MEGCEEAVLSLDFGPSFVSKTIAEFVTRISTIGNAQKRLNKVDEYVDCLEEEMRKIDPFKRDLPLCMFLLSDAIVYLKEVSRRWCKRRDVEAERPVLREIDLMKGSEEERGLEVAGDKKSWTSSFQLWSTDLNPAPESTKLIVNKVQETNNAKMPLVFDIIESKEGSELKTLKTLEDEMPVTELSLVPPVASSPVVKLGANELRSSIVGGVAASGPRSVQLDWRNAMVMPHHQQHQSRRKQRRCWSSELHKAFVRALEELGGPHVATPKQIRDLMQVDGLTNDEVKSHLQKYRLHIRRSPKKQIDSSGSQSTAVLGNSWNNNDPSVEYFKDSESGSPPGPLDLLVHHENDGSYD